MSDPSTQLDSAACTDLLNRLRRAEGQLRGIQRMVEAGEDCLRIGQQFCAVRKALDSAYMRMSLCFLEQQLRSRLPSGETQAADISSAVKELETMLVNLR